jgi:tetratricopeptide (TPR) repeat protein
MSKATPHQVQKLLKTADNRFEKSEYKKALEGYKKTLSYKTSQDIEMYCYFKIGLSLQYLDSYIEALGAFDKSISIKKTFEAFYYKGSLLLYLKKFKEAEDSIKQAIKLSTEDKKSFPAYLNLGRLYILQNKLKEAIKILKTALEIKHNDVHALLLLAETHKQLKNKLEAKNTYEKILTIKQNKDAIIGLASIFLEENEEQKAISLIKGYLQHNQDAELLKIKGEIHYSLNDFLNALSDFKKARKINNSEQLLIREARCLLSLNKIDEAISLVQDYITLKNDSILPKIFLAEIYATIKKSNKASELLNELIQTSSEIQTRSDLSQAVANALLLNNEYEKAEELYKKANELGLQSWTITKQLTIISIEKEEFMMALERIEKLFSLAENNFEIGHSYHLKAIVYFKQENYDETVKIIDQGLSNLKKNKNEQYYILALLQAKAKIKLNAQNEAEKIINQILSEYQNILPMIKADSELNSLLNQDNS